MKTIIYYTSLIILSFLCTRCSDPSPSKEEMVGKWVGGNGAEVDINANGTFTGKHLPFKRFFAFIKPQDSTRTEFDGEGEWTITKDDSYWKIKLDFNTSSAPGYLCVAELLIGGQNGFLGNKPPWYLYYWMEGEGGERFEFLRR